MKFSEIIHHNRDENSFTARVFEGYLIPLWAKDPNMFQSFLKMLLLDSGYNYEIINQRFGQSFADKFKFKTLRFIDSMLFLENLDIYGYCCNQRNPIDLNIDSENIDKTEFDCVVVAEDEVGKEIILAFEVKCFSDLVIEEIERQNKLLQIYKNANLFDEFYHFAILSSENIERARIFKNHMDQIENGLYIISWTAIIDYIERYIPEPEIQRFIKDIEFKKLHRKITKHGDYQTPRKLISEIKPE